MPVASIRPAAWLAALLVILAGAGHAAAHEPQAPHCPPAAARVPAGEPAAAATDGGTLELAIPDVPVTTQDARELRFYTDLVRDRVVVVNFIFTSCTTICPPLGATFGKLQSLLGPRLGREVALISVSVDPVTDTPAKLKAWAAQFHAGPGWTLVTGRKPSIDRLLRALDAGTGQPQEHTPMILIGNDARHAWRRAFGLSPASALAREIEAVAAAPVVDLAAVGR